MQYKTIVLHLLEQHPEIYDPLRRHRRMLPTLEYYARELKTLHDAMDGDPGTGDAGPRPEPDHQRGSGTGPEGSDGSFARRVRRGTIRRRSPSTRRWPFIRRHTPARGKGVSPGLHCSTICPEPSSPKTNAVVEATKGHYSPEATNSNLHRSGSTRQPFRNQLPEIDTAGTHRQR